MDVSVHNWNRPLGFTLIEMITTMSVLAVLIAVSVPSFLSFQRNALIENSAIKLLSLFEIAQSESLKQNNEIHVYYIPSTNVNDGCFGLSFDPKINQNLCDEENGLPRFILKKESELIVLAPSVASAIKLFHFSPITGLPSLNTTIKLIANNETEKISGILVRRYAGIRGCSDTLDKGWDRCPNNKNE